MTATAKPRACPKLITPLWGAERPCGRTPTVRRYQERSAKFGRVARDRYFVECCWCLRRVCAPTRAAAVAIWNGEKK